MKIVSWAADRLLSLVVPRAVAHAACTGLDRECWCDYWDGRLTWVCAYCQYCPARRCGPYRPDGFSCP